MPPATYGSDVMRLLGILALVTPIAVGTLFLTNPGLTSAWVDVGDRPVVAAVAALIIAVGLSGLLSLIIVRLRFGRLVKAAELIAAGDYSIAVSTRGGSLE